MSNWPLLSRRVKDSTGLGGCWAAVGGAILVRKSESQAESILKEGTTSALLGS